MVTFQFVMCVLACFSWTNIDTVLSYVLEFQSLQIKLDGEGNKTSDVSELKPFIEILRAFQTKNNNHATSVIKRKDNSDNAVIKDIDVEIDKLVKGLEKNMDDISKSLSEVHSNASHPNPGEHHANYSHFSSSEAKNPNFKRPTTEVPHHRIFDLNKTVEQKSEHIPSSQAVDYNSIGYHPGMSYVGEIVNVAVEIDIAEPVFTVEEHYLSFNIDFEMFYYIKDPWIKFNMTSPRLVTLLKGLSPALWRIGGTASEWTLFDVPKVHLDAAQLQPRSIVMTKELLTQFVKATLESGNRFLYDLNLQLRMGTQWNPANAIRMFEFLAEHGYGENLDFELGNEPDGYPMSPERMAEDFVMLHRVMQTYPNLAKSRIVGPDCVGVDKGSKGWNTMNALASRAGDFIKAITYHQYYFRGTEVTYKDYVNTKYFSKFISETLSAQSAVQMSKYPNTSVWIGETADGWDRGTCNVSDRYVSGFLWLEKLGLAARMGIGLVMRQTLRHGNYQMIGDYLEPNPDYWLSYVYKQLVGTRVLNVVVNGTPFSSVLSCTSDLTTRVYAHCTRINNNDFVPKYPKGSITIIALNFSPNKTKSLQLPPAWRTSSTDLYLLTPPGGNLVSQQVLLNGKELKLVSETQLPHLTPQILSPQQPFNLPPLTFGFLVVPHADAKACH